MTPGCSGNRARLSTGLAGGKASRYNEGRMEVKVTLPEDVARTAGLAGQDPCRIGAWLHAGDQRIVDRPVELNRQRYADRFFGSCLLCHAVPLAVSIDLKCFAITNFGANSQSDRRAYCGYRSSYLTSSDSS